MRGATPFNLRVGRQDVRVSNVTFLSTVLRNTVWFLIWPEPVFVSAISGIVSSLAIGLVCSPLLLVSHTRAAPSMVILFSCGYCWNKGLAAVLLLIVCFFDAALCVISCFVELVALFLCTLRTFDSSSKHMARNDSFCLRRHTFAG